MTTNYSLQVSSFETPPVAIPGQRRFGLLVRQIEQAQQRIETWRIQQRNLEHLHAMVVLPLQRQVFALQRKWVFGLDRIAHWANWTDAESDTLRHLLSRASMDLLLRDPSDTEIQRLYAQYADRDFANEHARLQQVVEARLPQTDGVTDGPRLHGIAANNSVLPVESSASQQRLSKKQLAARLAAQERRAHDALQLSSAARDLYRNLVSDLHPDREPDLAMRSVKTGLMQMATQAYARDDVFALLSVQAQADAQGVRQTEELSPDRIKRFNKLLAEQLADLKTQIDMIESRMLGLLGLPMQTRCNPGQCDALVKQAVRRWRQRRQELEDDMRGIETQSDAKSLLQGKHRAGLQLVVRRLVSHAAS
jgi:hypothetical protein